MSERSEEEQPRFVDRRASTSPENETGKQAPGDPAELERVLAEEREKAQSFYASWQRSAADFQNYKRRVEQEREEMARLANAAFVINILPLLDDLERALHSVDAHLAGMTWVDGIRLIYRKFEQVLELNGVQEIQAEGLPFDPTLHEAVMFGDGEEGKVISVAQKGYTLGGRVIRPAMVVVGKKS